MAPSPSTLKALGAVSGNMCAFPGCIAPVYDTRYNILVGEVCHIEAKSKDGPRYNAEQTEEQRHGFDNLMFLCSPHHTIIDDKSRVDEFTVAVLKSMKRDHEARSHNTILTEDVLERLVRKILDLQTPSQTLPKVVPVIASHRTSADNPGGIDYYGFWVSLRNDGDKTIRSFRLEAEIPNEYADPTHLHSMRGCQVRGDVTLYRHTEEGHPRFVLHPKDTSDVIMNINYIMRFDQYKDASGVIKVSVYSDDHLSSSVDYPIAGNRNKDRMDQLGLQA